MMPEGLAGHPMPTRAKIGDAVAYCIVGAKVGKRRGNAKKQGRGWWRVGDGLAGKCRVAKCNQMFFFCDNMLKRATDHY